VFTCWQLLNGRVSKDEMCGKASALPEFSGNLVLTIWLVATVAAFGLNLRIFHYIFLHRMKMNGRHYVAGGKRLA
jgi:hypothetical protein